MENTSLTSAYGRRGGVTGKTVSRVSMDNALSKIATGERTISEGQTLKARVLDFMGKDLTLRLPDGTVVQARTSQGTALSIGQNAEFQVVQSNHEQLLLRLVNSDTANSANSVAGRALAAAGLPMNEENLSLVNTLLENRLPVDADSIRTLVQQANTYKGTEVSTLAQMNKYNIPVNQKNIDQYNNYLNYEHRMMPQLEGLADALASPELAELLEQYGVSAETLDALAAKAQTADGTVEGQPANSPANAVAADAEALVNNAEIQAKPETAGMAGDGENTASAVNNPNVESAVKQSGINNAENGAEPVAQNSDNINSTAAGQAANAAPTADGFINAKSSEAISFLDRWTLTPEQLREGSVEEVFERLNGDLKQISSALRKAKAEHPEMEESLSKLLNDAAKSSQNIRDNLEFMNLLNRFFPYAQLPVRLEEKYQHGELYVYSRKKAKAADGSASVLLHLDMSNLGPTDIYLNLSGTTLGAKFYLQDDDIAELFRENLPDLTTRLENQGLTVNCELLPREEAEDPVHEFLAPDPNVSMKRYRFDCRA